MKNCDKGWDNLTEKQKAFIDYYIATHNASESARKAGYSARNSGVIGKSLADKFRHIIRPRLDQLQNGRIMEVQDILTKLSDIANGTEKDAFGLDVSNQDKLKALELLGKSYQLYTEKTKVDMDMDINVNLLDEGEE